MIFARIQNALLLCDAALKLRAIADFCLFHRGTMADGRCVLKSTVFNRVASYCQKRRLNKKKERRYKIIRIRSIKIIPRVRVFPSLLHVKTVTIIIIFPDLRAGRSIDRSADGTQFDRCDRARGSPLRRKRSERS